MSKQSMTDEAGLRLGRRHGRVGPHPHGGTLVDRRDGRHPRRLTGARPSSHARATPTGAWLVVISTPDGKSFRPSGMNWAAAPLWWLKVLPTTAFLEEHP